VARNPQVELGVGVLGGAGAAGFAELSLEVVAGVGVVGVELSALVSVDAGGVTEAVELRLSFL
jgi:hypothetical protein